MFTPPPSKITLSMSATSTGTKMGRVRMADPPGLRFWPEGRDRDGLRSHASRGGSAAVWLEGENLSLVPHDPGTGFG